MFIFEYLKVLKLKWNKFCTKRNLNKPKWHLNLLYNYVDCQKKKFKFQQKKKMINYLKRLNLSFFFFNLIFIIVKVLIFLNSFQRFSPR